MPKLDSYEQKLLDGWEEVFKKGQLTLWILLALKEGPKHMASIKDFIWVSTNGLLEADDKSMYRALRRYHDVDMVSFTSEPSKSGPDLKVYRLTRTGRSVLQAFVQRNFLDVFLKPEIVSLLKS